MRNFTARLAGTPLAGIHDEIRPSGRGVDMKPSGRSLARTVAAGAIVWMVLGPARASASPLPDGTPIHLRLVGVINSETSTRGEPILFVVTSSIGNGKDILIERGTPVTGVILDARRARWGFRQYHARLVFKFNYMTSRQGVVIALRTSPVKSQSNRVKVDRYGLEHELRWAGSADTFNAYVDGDYEL
jgi:hypothetical protein